MTEGLRQRQLRETRRALETAAVDIAYEQGVDRVTIERVCAAADVSRSTFFNYFWSLEQAIFGTTIDYDSEPIQAILERHADDLVLAATLIVTTSVRGAPDDDVTRRRFALFAREPGTTSTVSWASSMSREGLIAVIAAWLDAHPEHARLAGADHETEARLTVSLSITLGDEALRHLREVDGEFPIDLQAYYTARRDLAAIGMSAG